MSNNAQLALFIGAMFAGGIGVLLWGERLRLKDRLAETEDELQRWKRAWRDHDRWLALTHPGIELVLTNLRQQAEGKHPLDVCWPPSKTGPWEVSRLREVLKTRYGLGSAGTRGVRAIDDTARLDWIAQQGGDEFGYGVIADAPGDGNYWVSGMDGARGQGKTFREALDAAIAGVASVEASSITAMQALEALDELEASARGDEPFNHFAAPLIRQFIEQDIDGVGGSDAA
jgi:hypothetical protein